MLQNQGRHQVQVVTVVEREPGLSRAKWSHYLSQTVMFVQAYKTVLARRHQS